MGGPLVVERAFSVLSNSRSSVMMTRLVGMSTCGIDAVLT